MNSWEFSLDNGKALIMPAGGSSACGTNFTAGKNDVVWKLNGNMSMNIDEYGYVTITLTNMHGLIFANKANYSGWFYYDTAWARNHNNCVPIYINASTARQGDGAWYEGNTAWKRAAGWKGGTGINGYDQYIKYHYDQVEPDCAGEYVVGTCCTGKYIGSAKDISNMTFNLGRVNFDETKGFWLGANLALSSEGWEQWQYIPFPVTTFSAPNVSYQQTDLDICYGYVLCNVTANNSHESASQGGVWELQYSLKEDFSDAVTTTIENTSNTVLFENVQLLPNTTYYARVRLKVSDILFSVWRDFTMNVQADLPKQDDYVVELSESDRNKIKHGVLVTGSIVE